MQRFDLERTGAVYMAGEWITGGRWYYYLYALGIKTPTGMLILMVVTAALSFLGKGYNAGWRHEALLVMPAIAVLTVVSSQTKFTGQCRYVLPALPFAFIWTAKAGRSFELRHSRVAAITGLCVSWASVSSLAQFPHSLGYVTELMGGPTRGSEHLIGSDGDWGQDLLYLKHWVASHPEATPLRVAFYGGYAPSTLGLCCRLPPPGKRDHGDSSLTPPGALGPQPGWYAVSVSVSRGLACFVYDCTRVGYLSSHCHYEYFERIKPVAWAGTSIAIYHVTRADALHARDEMRSHFDPSSKCNPRGGHAK